jgi:hypothetical protein
VSIRIAKTLFWVGVTAVCVIVAAVLGTVWWGLWMNHGWPGATGWIAKLLGADGERYYDAMQDEMTAWCFAVLVALAVGWRLSRKKRP